VTQLCSTANLSNLMSLVLLFLYLMLNIFRMLIHPSSGACDLFVELFHTTHEITQQISRKLLRMNVLTSETCWALNKETIKQVTSIWSLFIHLSRWCTVRSNKHKTRISVYLREDGDWSRSKRLWPTLNCTEQIISKESSVALELCPLKQDLFTPYGLWTATCFGI